MMAFLSNARKVIASAPFVALVGAGFIAYGAAEIYRPAGWIVGGLLLILAAWDSRS
jgi:hypothetical protein